ncbi:MAG: oligosaccharide flippase family protein [Anaeroplasma sp.]
MEHANMNEKQKDKGILFNIFKVMLSNICIVFAGIFTAFIIPSLIDLENYGYYKVFTLYVGYLMIFQFGISEGVYLKYSGETYENLNKYDIRMFSKILFIISLFTSFIGILISIILGNNEYSFILLMLSLFLISDNITRYCQYISQMTKRFNELTIRNVLKSILTILSVIIPLLLSKIFVLNWNYHFFVYIYVVISYILAFWYVFTYRKVIFGKSSDLSSNSYKISSIIKIGFPLLISNLCINLIFSIDRQFVSLTFDKNSYAIYAFAYNMLNLVIVGTSAAATVLFPSMKQDDEETVLKKFPILNMLLNLFIFLGVAAYFPLIVLINHVLPKYSLSFEILRIIFPAFAFTSSVTTILHNYYKKFGLNFVYFIISIIILVLSIGANIIAYLWFKSMESISIASIIVILLWYMISTLFFNNKYSIKWITSFVYIVIMTGFFYLISFIPNVYIGFCVYILVYFCVSFLIYNKSLIIVVKRILSRIRKKN